jgi:outer membrane receptor protein involved in Fe transport
MSGDPPLKQIISRNAEIGVRGATLLGGMTLGYDADAYDNNTSDDIEFLQSPYNTTGSGYFANIGSVRRAGFDTKLTLQTARWQVYGGYSFISATYGSSFIEQSNSPSADANGDVTVSKGSHLPGIPSHLFKFGARYWLTPKWQIGLTGTAQTSAYMYGDEANLNRPLPGYVVLNLDMQYQVTKRLQLFANLDNFTCAKYYNYGTFSPLGAVYTTQALDNPRSYSPAAPVGVIGGMKLTF